MDENTSKLQERDSEPPAQPLLSELYASALKQLKNPTTPKRVRTVKFCIECGEHVPIYSNYFCEAHLMEFLNEEESEEEFNQTKAQFTI